MLITELIEHILAAIPNRTIGLLGDLFLDRYLDIDPKLDEPSVETGLTAYQVVGVRSYPGALGTVLNNLAALGVGRIVPISIIGDDGEGYELRQALARTPGVELDCIITAADRRTPTYTKPMSGGRELNRLDIKNRTPTPEPLQDWILALLEDVWRKKVDALIVLDQVSEKDCGVVTGRVREHVGKLASRNPTKFILADSRERIGWFRNVCVKPNEDECLPANFINPPKEYDRSDRVCAPINLGALVGGPVFCTQGKHGIRYVPKREADGSCKTVLIPAYPVSGPIDIVGAGDSCSAGITCAMVAGATHEQAAAFGNLVASITIQQIGVTGTASPEQVRQRWREVQGSATGGT